MARGAGVRPIDWAARVARRFAAATNLSIAGRRFALVGTGPRADTLRAMLGALGGIDTGTAGAPDVIYCVADAPLDRATVEWIVQADAAFAGRTRPLILVDAGGPGVGLRDLGEDAEAARPGVGEVRIGDSAVFVVRDTKRRVDIRGRAADRIDWARQFMPIASQLAAEFAADGTLAGIRIGVSMVLEPKTAVLALLLRDAGAQVAVYAHADETDDAVAEVLRSRDIPVDAHSGATPTEERTLALRFLDRDPQILLDDGAHVIRLAHQARPDLLARMIGAAEETTSGLTPLRAMSAAGTLRIPVIAVNDAETKTRFDNLYGTGQSCVFAVLDLLDSDLDGRRVVIAGFGHVGQGVARVAAALGARVTVAEVDPLRALRATYAGFAVQPLIDAVATADIVISATGVRHTIDLDVLAACATDAAIAVAGGVPEEVAIESALATGAIREPVDPKVERLRLPGGGSVLLLDSGSCINITAAEGNPIDIMDLSFAVQLQAIRQLVDSRGARTAGVHEIGVPTDARIATLALAAGGWALPAARPAPADPEPDPGRFGRVPRSDRSRPERS